MPTPKTIGETTSETTSETITVVVSNKADVDFLRAKVRNGECASEAEAVAESIAHLREDEKERDHWLRTVGAASYEAYKTNPDDVFTLEEVQEHLAHERKEREERAAQVR